MDFQPLQKHEVSMFLEPFVDNAQAKSLTETVLVGIALMVLATVITFIFLSAYNKSKYLFIVVYSLMVLVYSIIMISLILMKKEDLSQLQYEMYMGSSLGIIIVAIIFIGFFTSKHRQGMTPSQTSSYMPSSYQPPS